VDSFQLENSRYRLSCGNFSRKEKRAAAVSNSLFSVQVQCARGIPLLASARYRKKNSLQKRFVAPHCHDNLTQAEAHQKMMIAEFGEGLERPTATQQRCQACINESGLWLGRCFWHCGFCGVRQLCWRTAVVSTDPKKRSARAEVRDHCLWHRDWSNAVSTSNWIKHPDERNPMYIKDGEVVELAQELKHELSACISSFGSCVMLFTLWVREVPHERPKGLPPRGTCTLHECFVYYAKFEAGKVCFFLPNLFGLLHRSRLVSVLLIYRRFRAYGDGMIDVISFVERMVSLGLRPTAASPMWYQTLREEYCVYRGVVDTRFSKLVGQDQFVVMQGCPQEVS